MTTKRFIFISLFVLIFLITILFSAFFLPFKTQYISTFSQISNQNGVDLSLALAIAKAESKFDKNAKSAKGAIGLMQIKLETANYVLQKNGRDQLTEEQLFLPQNNILCGIKYLAYLQTRFEDEDSIICAYNAGETAVAGWLKDKAYSQNGKTLDFVPFKETKNYLSKVKFNKHIYQIFLDSK